MALIMEGRNRRGFAEWRKIQRESSALNSGCAAYVNVQGFQIELNSSKLRHLREGCQNFLTPFADGTVWRHGPGVFREQARISFKIA